MSAAAGIIIEILYVLFVVFQGDEKSIPTYILIYALSFILFYSAYRLIIILNKNNTPSERNKLLYLIVLFGVLFRVTLIPSDPSTSGDVYRYLWEGKVTANGHNPFELSPDDKALEYLHTKDLPRLVTYKNMTAIYPPFSQYIFASAYLLTEENDTGLKLIYLLAELVTMLYIIKILRFRNQNPLLILMYAWLPLPVMEYFINSHIDAVGIMFFIMFVYYSLQNRYILASIPFALGVLTKLYPLIFIPLLIKKFGLRKTLVFVLTATVIIALFFVPFLSPQSDSASQSLSTYLRKWSFNGSLFKVVYWITNSGYDTRSLMLALMVVSIGNIAIKYKDFLKGVYGVLICFIIFSATLYPWYLGWIAAVNPMFVFASVTSLLFTSNFSNFTPMADKWTEYWWVIIIQYLPFYALLIKEVYPMFKARYLKN